MFKRLTDWVAVGVLWVGGVAFGCALVFAFLVLTDEARADWFDFSNQGWAHAVFLNPVDQGGGYVGYASWEGFPDVFPGPTGTEQYFVFETPGGSLTTVQRFAADGSPETLHGLHWEDMAHHAAGGSADVLPSWATPPGAGTNSVPGLPTDGNGFMAGLYGAGGTIAGVLVSGAIVGLAVFTALYGMRLTLRAFRGAVDRGAMKDWGELDGNRDDGTGTSRMGAPDGQYGRYSIGDEPAKPVDYE